MGVLPYVQQTIKTGEDGGLVGDSKEVMLVPHAPVLYWTGMSYHQQAEDIHRTIAQDGTITLIERERGPPLEEALVFWPRNSQWVSAEPKPANDWQIMTTVDYALQIWRECI
jgi:hypothetical protein